MPQIHLHYDGWLTLPVELRQHLGVVPGNRLEIEVVNHTLVLRSAGHVGLSDPQVQPALATTAAGTESVAVKRRPGRPRKVAAPDVSST